MQYNDQVSRAIKSFSDAKKISIEMSRGASVLTLDDGREIWLEAPHESELLVLHIAVKDQAGFESLPNFWKGCLSFNADVDTNQGSWLGFHNETNTLRLCIAIPKKHIDSHVIENSVSQIASLSNNFEHTHLTRR